MEPEKNSQSTIDDLLEIVLDKGIVLNTDLIISVANIPLIGISLRAAIASLETMLNYGMMEQLDKRTRQWALQQIRDKKINLHNNENIIENMYGSYYYEDGIYRSWRSGKIYFTDQRLILYKELPAEVLLSIGYESITGARKYTYKNTYSDSSKNVIILLLDNNKKEVIYAHETDYILNIITSNVKKFKDDFFTDFEVGDLNVP